MDSTLWRSKNTFWFGAQCWNVSMTIWKNSRVTFVFSKTLSIGGAVKIQFLLSRIWRSGNFSDKVPDFVDDLLLRLLFVLSRKIFLLWASSQCFLFIFRILPTIDSSYVIKIFCLIYFITLAWWVQLYIWSKLQIFYIFSRNLSKIAHICATLLNGFHTRVKENLYGSYFSVCSSK